jgi:DNA-binding beta-propeller fold protein YncE
MNQDAEMIVKLPLAVRPDNLCFNVDGGQLFITGEGSDAVVVVFPYYVPQVAETVLAGHAPGAMGVSRTHLFVASPESGDVSILNIARRKIEAVTAVGADPGFITVTPDGNFALVLNRASGDMAVIRAGAIVAEAAGRLKSAPLYTMIPVGSRPVSAAVKPV